MEKELSEIAVKNPANPGDWVATAGNVDDISNADPNTTADQFEELENNAAVLARLENRFNDVKDALAKIESGQYGKCEVSGEDIETDRLEANPAARTCREHM